MSESAAEGTAGDTGEVIDQPDTSAQEDQEAQAALDKIMAENDPEALRAEMDRWKRTAQRHERAARDNSKAADKLRQIEEANKSDLQKAVEAREAAERERDSARTQQNRMLAAAAHDLPPELIDFLGEGTSEEITERAEQLSGIIKSAAEKLAASSESHNGRPPASARRRPVESMRPGAAPASAGIQTPDQMFRQLITGDQD